MPRKRQSTKARIVKSAWNLFYKNGYEQTTVEEIIAASKTSKGTFYRSYPPPKTLILRGFLEFTLFRCFLDGNSCPLF